MKSRYFNFHHFSFLIRLQPWAFTAAFGLLPQASADSDWGLNKSTPTQQRRVRVIISRDLTQNYPILQACNDIYYTANLLGVVIWRKIYFQSNRCQFLVANAVWTAALLMGSIKGPRVGGARCCTLHYWKRWVCVCVSQMVVVVVHCGFTRSENDFSSLSLFFHFEDAEKNLDFSTIIITLCHRASIIFVFCEMLSFETKWHLKTSSRKKM